MARYVVTAGYVTVETELPGGGRALIDVARGSTLPADVPQEQIDWELRLETIELVGDAQPAEVAAEDMPAGMSVASTLTWVGDNLSRARLALAAEQSSGSPRATLIDRLEKLLA